MLEVDTVCVYWLRRRDGYSHKSHRERAWDGPGWGGGGALGRRNSCPYYTEHAHVVNAFVSPTKHQLLVAHTPQGRPETNCEVVNSMQSTTGPHTQ